MGSGTSSQQYTSLSLQTQEAVDGLSATAKQELDGVVGKALAELESLRENEKKLLADIEKLQQTKDDVDDDAKAADNGDKEDSKAKTPEAAQEETARAVLAERARIEALSPEELEALSRKYHDGESVWEALHHGDSKDTVLLSATHIKNGQLQCFPKRDDALIGGDTYASTRTLKNLWNSTKLANSNSFNKPRPLPVIAISHFWRTKAHPDPCGVTLQIIREQLEGGIWSRFANHLDWRGEDDCEMGLFFDFSSLYQEPRSPEQQRIFKDSLGGVNLWYAHRLTSVWLITAGKDEEIGLSYWQKGWTTFEYQLSTMVKTSSQHIDTFSTWPQLLNLGEDDWRKQQDFSRPVPAEPLAFFDLHAFDDLVFTNKADQQGIVAPKFQKTVLELFGGADNLNWQEVGWGDKEMIGLAAILPICFVLRHLDLSRNPFTHLPESLGQLHKLESLYLYECRSLITLPESLGQLQALRELLLGDCSALTDLQRKKIKEQMAGICEPRF